MSQTAQLPKTLVPFVCASLERVGRLNDGGYVINGADIADSDVLLSFGVNDDWSFEEQFLQRHNVPLFAYDGSMGLQKFSKAFKRSIPFGLKSTARHWHTLKSYKSFFQGSRVHVQKFVGLDLPPRHVSLASIFDELDKKALKKAFLKIDIEGWEYRIIDDLLGYADRIAGATIEFHDVDLHAPRIEAFIKAWPLKLVHTHCNTFAPLSKSGLPMVIECSFSASSPAKSRVAALPHPLDQSNNRKVSDYSVRF
jgi:Methyltransferase FkbM domain